MANLESAKEQDLTSKEVNPYIESTQKQIQVLKSSELSSLQGFDNFVSYLEKKSLVFKSKKELDSVIFTRHLEANLQDFLYYQF